MSGTELRYAPISRKEGEEGGSEVEEKFQRTQWIALGMIPVQQYPRTRISAAPSYKTICWVAPDSVCYQCVRY
eukprot:2670626-Rhodomonas_salina.2